MQNNNTASHPLSKVPAVTAAFWLTKIAATTLGETGGDAVTMSMNLGYLTGTLIFAIIFLIAVVVQINRHSFNKWIYWFTVVATTTVGTTMADFADRPGHRVFRRHRAAEHPAYPLAFPVENHLWYGCGQFSEQRRHREFLLGHYYVFTNPGHGLR